MMNVWKSTVVAFGTTLVAHSAVAQDAYAEPADEASAPVEAAVEAEAPAAPAPEAPPAEEPVPAAAPSGISFLLFGDGYANFQTSKAGTPTAGHRAYDSVDAAGTNSNGFGVGFLGLDASYSGGNWGATTSLRYGPAADRFGAYGQGGAGGGPLTAAYVSWAPTDSLSIDVGQFGTIFGAEVGENWKNLNYTRGALYYLMQPFWHTGLKSSLSLGSVSLTGMVVNGVNNINLGAELPSIGLQAAYSNDNFALIAGTLQTLGESGLGFDRFFDLVATLSLGDFSTVLNLDFNIDEETPFGFSGGMFGGASLAAGYAFTEMFSAAVRGEYLVPDVNDFNTSFATGTATLEMKPIAGSSNLLLRWDNRVEYGLSATYADLDGNASNIWYTSVVGLVAHTDGLF